MATDPAAALQVYMEHQRVSAATDGVGVLEGCATTRNRERLKLCITGICQNKREGLIHRLNGQSDCYTHGQARRETAQWPPSLLVRSRCALEQTDEFTDSDMIINLISKQTNFQPH